MCAACLLAIPILRRVYESDKTKELNERIEIIISHENTKNWFPTFETYFFFFFRHSYNTRAFCSLENATLKIILRLKCLNETKIFFFNHSYKITLHLKI